MSRVVLPAELHARLRREAQRRHVSTAALVREALDAWLRIVTSSAATPPRLTTHQRRVLADAWDGVVVLSGGGLVATARKLEALGLGVVAETRTGVVFALNEHGRQVSLAQPP